ncbi:sensor histidine kinase DpiB [Budviciaceae bacterium CWB-B4]|uniref:histidine kinase n=1 Tax=Limnobaculum xujianqingii TaxID=2738837 RepID=A0A9D7AF26_9GAMM|nr:sensor histidine kinase DpiB [Limnobaculum xujianqingii]MBK5071502.1 sensor histidine kinase DpiB [Limnobaculum xujianqingii]MBK5174811.1 sensor histidine kinase DpiB [Limnobaculum xujianqingii]
MRIKTKKEYIKNMLKNMSFQWRVFLLLLVVFTLLLGALNKFMEYQLDNYLTDKVSEIAMNQAKIIASMDDVIEGVEQRDTKKLKKIADRLSMESNFSYLVIGDENSTRLYHPNPEKIGFTMQWNKPGALERGESYIISSEGSMGLALRAKTPIWDKNNHVIGVISLGYLNSKIDMWRSNQILPLTSALLLILFILILLSWQFSTHIKKQMMGMEPMEIARVQRQQDALFGAVFEGLIAVDTEGKITAINQNAQKMFKLAGAAKYLVGRQVQNLISPPDYFLETSGTNRIDDLLIINGLKIIANRVGIWIDGEFQGWVVSFRRHDEINTLSAQLSQIQQYVENLRTLRHEHLNWISTIGGLLQLKEYDRALEMVKFESSNQQSLIDSISQMFKNRLIAGLLFGKYHRAKELGLEIQFTPGSTLSANINPLTENELASILGNLLNNAFEATLKNPDSNKLIEFFISDEGSELIIEVSDNGCGIEPDIRDTIFTRGVTSKNSGDHGIGLYLVKTYIDQYNGTITLDDNEPCGTVFSIFIPKGKGN